MSIRAEREAIGGMNESEGEMSRNYNENITMRMIRVFFTR